MLVALISAGSGIIVGVLTLIGVLISNNAHDAVIDEKISELTREVRKHNNFAEQIPYIQKDVENLFHRYEELYEWKSKLP